MNIKNKKGFTLIELLVVVAIISMLTSVILSSLSTARQRGRDTGKIRALKEVQNALQLYATDKGGFPGTYNSISSEDGSYYDGLSAYLVPKYISKINTGIYYTSLDSNNSFCIVGTINCPKYWLGTSLERNDHGVLKTDKDYDVSTDYYNGKHDDCHDSSNNSNPDKCYDINSIN